MKRTVVFLTLLVAWLFSKGQHPETHPPSPSSYQAFFSEPSRVIPLLYEEHAFDSLQHYLDTRQYRSRYTVHIFAIRVLLKIERKEFSADHFSDTAFYMMLEDYAAIINLVNSGSGDMLLYPPFGNMGDPAELNATTQETIQLFVLSRDWALDLLKRVSLDSTETFLCRVFAGKIRHPLALLQSNKQTCSDLHSLIRKSIRVDRNRLMLNASFVSGLWAPNGNLRALGAHPYLGLELGLRYRRNELDGIAAFRFVFAPHDYSIKVNNIVYRNNYYTGQYSGLEYTYYFRSTSRWETGIIAGVGEDETDMSYGDRTQPSSLSTASIYSTNCNLGLRMNYYYKFRHYLQLAVKYNFLHYQNQGGTNLSGNALTIDLSIGVHPRKSGATSFLDYYF